MFPRLEPRQLADAWEYERHHQDRYESPREQRAVDAEMARLLTDEHFPNAIVNRLRLLGHDVVRVRDLAESKSGDGLPDEAILSFGMSQNRIVLTYRAAA